MKTIRRGRITYYVKTEAVIVGIADFQFIAYTLYPLQNRKPFYDFKKAILISAEEELTSPVDLIRLAAKYNLKGVASHRPANNLEDEQ